MNFAVRGQLLSCADAKALFRAFITNARRGFLRLVSVGFPAIWLGRLLRERWPNFTMKHVS